MSVTISRENWTILRSSASVAREFAVGIWLDDGHESGHVVHIASKVWQPRYRRVVRSRGVVKAGPFVNPLEFTGNNSAT